MSWVAQRQAYRNSEAVDEAGPVDQHPSHLLHLIICMSATRASRAFEGLHLSTQETRRMNELRDAADKIDQSKAWKFAR